MREKGNKNEWCLLPIPKTNTAMQKALKTFDAENVDAF